MNFKKTLNNYYSKRAKEYEDIYHRQDKTRLKEQKLLAEYIYQVFKGRYVLELACGTGYWTKYLLKSAKKILATDFSNAMLEVASKRFAKQPKVMLLEEDAYNPPISFPKFNGSMANFWFSHIPKSKIKNFLDTLHSRLAQNSVIVFIDGVYIEGLGGELVFKEKNNDTFKIRTLSSGEQFEILKNYYSGKELEKIFSRYSKRIEIQYLTNFWTVKYHI